ncbi:hypothetical protein [Rhodococcus kronopolitis]|uniref:Bacteriocin biosynthesis cyclodehydratase domain-containing protein n=1 Tax=Rhodococcus kronopolitis TaxID=1460226 RepID=A0ABV9FNK9_9NOCA
MTPVPARRAGPQLDPRIPVLVRPSGVLQLGWDPERAVLLTAPDGVTPGALAGLLRLLDGWHSRPDVIWQAHLIGLDVVDTARILAELDAADLLVRPEATSQPRWVHVHGRGPLSDGLAAALTQGRYRLTRSRPLEGDADRPTGRADAVVLADDQVPDPRLVAELVAERVPHLLVRMRDGRGVVGPLVLPGHTSCLRCADLARSERDHEWPHLAAQLLGAVGHADHATVLTTVGLALGELATVLRGDPAAPPATLDATLELNLAPPTLVTRSWRRHPRCGCAAVAPDGGGGLGERADRQT